MSRSHRRPSEYSRGSSPRIDRTLSVTEASFQNLGLSETAGAPQLSISSPYQPSNRRQRSAPRSEYSSDYLTSEYDPSGYHRTTSPSSFSNLQQPPSTYEPSLLDPDYDQLFVESANYPSRATPYATSSLDRTAMG